MLFVVHCLNSYSDIYLPLDRKCYVQMRMISNIEIPNTNLFLQNEKNYNREM